MSDAVGGASESRGLFRAPRSPRLSTIAPRRPSNPHTSHALAPQARVPLAAPRRELQIIRVVVSRRARRPARPDASRWFGVPESPRAVCLPARGAFVFAWHGRPAHVFVSRSYPPLVPLRVALFTDTLGDVNGVSRFLRSIAELASPERDLHVLTSTRFECAARSNIHNIPALASCPMPGYAPLDLTLPNARALWARADELRPHAVHVSTPGPVGLVGRRYALRRALPLLGTYHTDFPAYIEHLFDDGALTWIARAAVRRFYAPFTRVLARTGAYAPHMASVGIGPERLASLPPGIDTELFHVRHRDTTGAIWRAIPGVRATSVKALYVGRVSVEKNLPMLARIWARVRGAASERGIDAQLLIVGDGPYRAAMRHALAPHDACFLGFRHGAELSTIYASCDLFLFPSVTDTLGQVVMEAQSSGLPAIVSDRGGPCAVVDDGRTGLVLGAAPERWIEGALRLITDAARRRAMSGAAHAKMRPLTIERSFAAFWNVHEEAIVDSRLCISQKHKPGHALARGPARR